MNVKKKIYKNSIFIIIVLFFSLSITSTIFINKYDKPIGNNLVNNFNNFFTEHEKNFEKLQKLKTEINICKYVRDEKLTRHSFRSTIEFYKIQFIQKMNNNFSSHKAGFLSYLITVSIIISISFFLIINQINNKVVKKNYFNIKNFNLFIFFYLFLLFYLSKPLGELRFSIFEFFFISVSLILCIKKKYLPYLLSVIICTLNRESGIITSLFWFLMHLNYNQSLTKIIKNKLFLTTSLSAPIVCLLILFYLNFDVIKCISSPNFLIAGSMSETIFEIKNPINFSIINHLFSNYILLIIPLILFYKKKNLGLLLICVIYLLIFLLFTPLNQYEIRILLLPPLMLYIFQN